MKFIKKALLFPVMITSFLLSSPIMAQKENLPKFNHYAYLFLGPNLNPAKDKTSITTPTFTFTAVGMDFKEKEKVLAVAKQMVAEGAQIIELCGGFGPLWVAKVSEAIQYQVPVGSVAYGPEARKPMLDLLSEIK